MALIDAANSGQPQPGALHRADPGAARHRHWGCGVAGPLGRRGICVSRHQVDPTKPVLRRAKVGKPGRAGGRQTHIEMGALGIFS